MEIVLWLTVVAVAALLLLLIVMMWRSWRRRVPPVFSPEAFGNEKSGEVSADIEGPAESPYPPGGRPAGPGAEGMAVSSPGDIVPGWNEGAEQQDLDPRNESDQPVRQTADRTDS